MKYKAKYLLNGEEVFFEVSSEERRDTETGEVAFKFAPPIEITHNGHKLKLMAVSEKIAYYGIA